MLSVTTYMQLKAGEGRSCWVEVDEELARSRWLTPSAMWAMVDAPRSMSQAKPRTSQYYVNILPDAVSKFKPRRADTRSIYVLTPRDSWTHWAITTVCSQRAQLRGPRG